MQRDGIESAKGAEVGGAGRDAGRLVHLEVGGSSCAHDDPGH